METAAGGRALLGPGEFRALATPSEAASREADWPNTTRLLPWGLAGFLVVLWCTPFDSIYLPFGGPVDITLDRPLLILLGGVWLLVSGSLARAPQPRTGPVHWAFGAFLVIAVLSILINAETLVRIDMLDSSVKKIALLASYFFFFVLATSILRPTEVAKFVKLVIVLATVTGVAVVIENRFSINVFHDWIGPLFPGYTRPFGIGILDSIGRKQVLGPGVQPLAVTTMLVMAMPFALINLLNSTERRQRWLYGIAIFLIFTGSLATEKKTGLVGAVAGLAVLFVYRPRQMARLLPFGALMLIVVHLFTPGAIGGVVDQFNPSSLNRVNTVQDRVRDYDAVTPDLAHNPILGLGWGGYNQQQHRILDNLYLTLAIEVGLLGVAAYLALLGTSFVLANRAARSRDPQRAPPGIAAAAAIVTVFVASGLLDFLSLPQLAYMFCFVAAIAVVLGRDAKGRAAHAG